MGDDGKRTLTPKLRFPEFRNAEGWITTPLGEEGDFLSSLTGKTAEHFGTGSAKFVTYMNVFTNTFTDMSSLGTVDVSDDEAQNTVEVGDVLFTVSSETPEEVGMSSVVLDTLPNCYVNSFCALFRFADGRRPNLRFLGYSLRQPLVRNHLATRAQGSTRFNLSKTAFRTLPLVLPSPPEQQKIADCLTSLDELIAAQGRKVEALKAHKKGLMQQLFPREGETLPRLRFPEFRNAGEWESKAIGDVFDTATGGTPDRANQAYWGGGIPWVTTSIVNFNVITSTEETITADGLENSAAKMFPKGTVLMALYGQGKTRGQVALLGIDATTNQACAAILPSEEVDPRFTFFNLSGRYEEIRKLSNSGGQENLSQGLLRDLPFKYPKAPEEQQRIADCLSVLDARLKEESQKLEALKVHKRGLMQQLFPLAKEN